MKVFSTAAIVALGWGGACADANNDMPAWVASDIPGPFTCAP